MKDATVASGTACRAPVFPFDIYRDPLLLEDVHKGWLRVKENAPPVFWTAENGGHWVANTATAVIEVLRHPETFSSRFLSIPPNPDQHHMIPESLDPPEHRPYRQLLRPFFESKSIEPLQDWIVEWTNRLIDKVIDEGECEFVHALGSRLPVSVFMEMFGFPLDRFDDFRALVTGFFANQSSEQERASLGGQIQQELAALITARQAEPRDDLVSKLAHIDFEDRKLSFHELMSIGFLMFLAGLDTVSVALTFGMRHLAHDEKLRQRIIDDPDCIDNVVEELLRRYTFVATPRHVTRDFELEGASLKQGDMISCPLMAVGWDAHLNPDPLTVSVDRPSYRHAAFGSGIHTCLGLHLARLELSTFYRIWFQRVGHFREVDTGIAPVMRGGSVMAMETLHLAWDRA